MKLITTIAPRLTGEVIVHLQSGEVIEFRADESGELSAEVAAESDVAHLLALPGGNFEPANVEDFERAEALVDTLLPKGDAEGEDGDDTGDEPGPDDEVVNGGLPVEANTPPTPARAGKAKAKAAAAQG